MAGARGDPRLAGPELLAIVGACRVALTPAGSDLAHDVHAEVTRRLERLADGAAPRRQALLREIAVELLLRKR